MIWGLLRIEAVGQANCLRYSARTSSISEDAETARARRVEELTHVNARESLVLKVKAGLGVEDEASHTSTVLDLSASDGSHRSWHC